MIRNLFCAVSFFCFAHVCAGQQVDRILRLTQSLQAKQDVVTKALDKSFDRWLNKLKKEEQRLYAILQKTDSIKAKNIFGNIAARYDSLKKLSVTDTGMLQYDASLDSFATAAKFTGNAALKDAVAKLTSKFNVKQLIKEKIAARKSELTQSGLGARLQGFNKQAYYYSQQLTEIRSVLKDKTKRERKAWELVRNSKPFKDFFAKHSEFAFLFPSPAVVSPSITDNGMQTRAYVQSLIERRRQSFHVLAAHGTVTENLDAAQAELNDLRSKLYGGDADISMPNFKPNSQKTKSFLKRIEFGYNLQSQRSNALLPSRSTVGVNLGYKLNDRSVIGIGAAYIAGLGSGWKNIRLTHEGIGLRSYMDLKIKGGIWMTGGYEMNYMQAYIRVSNIVDWQKTGLIGLTKKMKISGKKESKVQLLYDINHKNNGMPPIQFRVGQNLK